MLVQLYILKTGRINRFFQVYNSFLELYYPLAINFSVKLFYKHGSYLLLKLHFGTLKFKQISLKRPLDVALEILHLTFH